MKHLILGAMLCLVQQYSYACAEHALSFPGQNPLFGKNSLLVQYRIQQFTATETEITTSSTHARMAHGGPSSSPKTGNYNCVNESYTIVAQYYVGRKTKLFAQVPFYNNVAKSANKTYQIGNIGDITTGLQYNILQHQIDTSAWMYRLSGTAALVLPTGYFNAQQNDGIWHNLQPGRASYGHVFGLSALVKWHRTALAPEVSYQYNTPNKYLYQYGSTAIYSFRYIRYIISNNWQIVPNIGLQYIDFKTDKNLNKTENGTANKISYVTAGAGIYYRFFGINAEYSLPLHDAQGNGTKQKSTGLIQLSYSF